MNGNAAKTREYWFEAKEIVYRQVVVEASSAQEAREKIKSLGDGEWMDASENSHIASLKRLKDHENWH